MTRFAIFLLAVLVTTQSQAQLRITDAKRILFLGDSITNAGHYITLVETHLRLGTSGSVPEMINLGLSSETCSGLSEPAHPFPRPDVHERLERALAKTKPDLVFACYGMNDGIYYPLSDERFEKYKQGVNRIIDRVHGVGAKLVLMTPPPFDPLPLRKKGKLRPAGSDEFAWHSIYEDYDSVLAHYAKWILEQADRVEGVVDLRSPIVSYTEDKRKDNPEFTMSGDGVHLNNEGHMIMADAIMKAMNIKKADSVPAELLKLASKRQKLLHDAWLSEVGHKRPGVKPGLPIDEAIVQAAAIESEMHAN